MRAIIRWIAKTFFLNKIHNRGTWLGDLVWWAYEPVLIEDTALAFETQRICNLEYYDTAVSY